MMTESVIWHGFYDSQVWGCNLSVFHDAIGLLDFASDGFEHIMRNNLLEILNALPIATALEAPCDFKIFPAKPNSGAPE